jgi:hypothetical protein
VVIDDWNDDCRVLIGADCEYRPAHQQSPIANPSIANPSIANPSIANPSIANPSIANPSVANPSIDNPHSTIRQSTIRTRRSAIDSLHSFSSTIVAPPPP